MGDPPLPGADEKAAAELAERCRLTFELADLGIKLMRQNLRRAIEDLQQLGVDFALVGGLAVSIRAEPRFTRDVDCAVSVADDRDAERVVSKLLGRGYRASAQVEQ